MSVAHFICVFLTFFFGNKYWGCDFLKSLKLEKKIILTSCVETFYSLIDWNNPTIINKMYKVYLGDIPLKTKEVSCFGLFSYHHENRFVDMKLVFIFEHFLLVILI